jgi:hypothetical protein
VSVEAVDCEASDSLVVSVAASVTDDDGCDPSPELVVSLVGVSVVESSAGESHFTNCTTSTFVLFE